MMKWLENRTAKKAQERYDETERRADSHLTQHKHDINAERRFWILATLAAIAAITGILGLFK